MVRSCDCSNQNRRRRRTNAPPSRPITMAMAVRRCHMECIAQCSMTRASPEATGRRHWATTCSVLPQRPPERQQTKRRYNMYPLCWPFQWPWRCGGTIPPTSPDGGGSWLSQKPLNATIGRALALFLPIRHATPVGLDITLWKRAPVDVLAPNNNRGMTYQTDEKHLTNLGEYSVGVVKLACYPLNTRLLLLVFNNNLLKYL